MLRALGARLPLGDLVRIRLGIEAMHLSLPGGAAVGDAANVLLVRDAACVPASIATVAVASRKWLLMRAHALYIFLGATIGWATLGELSHALDPALMPGGSGSTLLPAGVAAAALLPLGASWAVEAALFNRWNMHAYLARGANALVERLPAQWGERVRERTAALRESWARASHATRESSSGLLSHRWLVAASTLSFLGVWLTEAFESWLVAHVLGIPLDFRQAWAMEAVLSLARSVAVFAPGALGVAELGYAACLLGFGVGTAATSAAFVVLKRAKEGLLIAVGYVALALQRRRLTRTASPLAPCPSPVLGRP
jgi:uncharacterized membrane protein YbhN (UPF0104 family)